MPDTFLYIVGQWHCHTCLNNIFVYRRLFLHEKPTVEDIAIRHFSTVKHSAEFMGKHVRSDHYLHIDTQQVFYFVPVIPLPAGYFHFQFPFADAIIQYDNRSRYLWVSASEKIYVCWYEPLANSFFTFVVSVLELYSGKSLVIKFLSRGFRLSK